MRESAMQYLVCPNCQAELGYNTITNQAGPVLEGGELICQQCAARYRLSRGVPRFVSDDNYASNFGLEWNIHARTQYDSYTGLNFSEKRFFGETRWPKDLAGETVLEVGSGSGRFTEQAASTGAFVVSVDYSCAVDANYQSNGTNENVLIIQADIYQMPLRANFFDKVFCFGVLQHTPDPRRAFLALASKVKPGGELVIDAYRKKPLLGHLQTKPFLRRLARNTDPNQLYSVTRRWVDLMWPVAGVIRRIPYIGPALNWRLMIADYSRLGLHGELLKEWAYLDTFDMLSPLYDFPQSISDVQGWFQEAGMVEIEVNRASESSLIEGRGRNPLCSSG